MERKIENPNSFLRLPWGGPGPRKYLPFHLTRAALLRRPGGVWEIPDYFTAGLHQARSGLKAHKSKVLPQ